MTSIQEIFSSWESFNQHHIDIDAKMRAEDKARNEKAAAFKPTPHVYEALPATLPRYPIFISPCKE